MFFQRDKEHSINFDKKPIRMPSQEDMFGGILMSELDNLARQTRRGLGVSRDKWGFLIFKFKSNRGHETYKVQIEIDSSGKLKPLNNGHYPGQIRNSCDDFIEIVNNKYTFNQ